MMNFKLTQLIFKVIGLSFILFTQVFAGVSVFPNFSNTSELVLNGDAATVLSADGTVLRLTPAQTNMAGSAFSQTTVNASDFSTFFKFRITDPGGRIFDCNTESGADGIVFVVQSVSSDIGGTGAGIGYAGIDDSVGVEFDTWCNGANNDPSSNHLGVVTGGSVRHEAVTANGTLPITTNFDNGNIWYAWIDYDGAVLEVRANQSGVRSVSPDLSVTVDIVAQLGGVNNAYVGFTSGTGADYGNHDIISWEYRDNFDPIPSDQTSNQACVPATLSTPDFILSIPRVEFDPGNSMEIIPISVDLRYLPTRDGKVLFEVIDAKVLSE